MSYLKFTAPKTFDVFFTVKLFNSVIHENKVTVQAGNLNHARLRGSMKIQDALQTLFGSTENYDYYISSVHPHGEVFAAETIDADLIEPKILS